MATFALTDATTWIHDYDWTTDLNQISLSPSVDELDSTTFGGSGFRSRTGGLRTVEANLSGFWQSATAAAPDPQAIGALGAADRVVTMSPTGAEGSVAYMYRAGEFSYQAFGNVGDLTPFSLSMMGTDRYGLVRGQVAATKQDVSAPGQLGSVLTLTAPSATQYVYCTVHVFGAGTTITLDLESDSAADMATATTQATIGPLTAAGGTWMTRVAGPLAGEAYWRLNVTAITGTFSIAAAIGVQ